MEKYSISVLGADKKQYEIADFRARGMNYTNAIGIIVTTEFMSVFWRLTLGKNNGEILIGS